MNANQLNLLNPEDLPIQIELTEANKNKLLLSLNIAQQAINSNCQKKAIFKIEKALEILGSTSLIANRFYDKNPKKHLDVLDYDICFNVNHVRAKEPEVCFVQGILITYRRFLLMCLENNTFNVEHIKIQQKGFEDLFQLMCRLLNYSGK